jgi:hypothetical protein
MSEQHQGRGGICGGSVAVSRSCSPRCGSVRGSEGERGLIGGLLRQLSFGGSQVFAPWQDTAYCLLAPNGSFELGSSGWSLGGAAAVVTGNAAALHPDVREGPRRNGQRSAHPRYWYGLLNKLLGITDVAVSPAGGGRAPTGQVRSCGGLLTPLPVVALVSSTSARVEITPLGSGSRWQIDDVYVDPYISQVA